MALFCIILICICKWTHNKVKEDIVTPDYPSDLKTEEEMIQNQWNHKKWFDYIFDPHYDVTTHTLNGGTDIPALGINTKNKANLYESLVFAMRYNHPQIARAISTVGVHKSSIFLSLTIDAYNYGYKSTLNAVQTFVKQIEFKQINLCLMDGPKDENKIYESGKIRRYKKMEYV